MTIQSRVRWGAAAAGAGFAGIAATALAFTRGVPLFMLLTFCLIGIIAVFALASRTLRAFGLGLSQLSSIARSMESGETTADLAQDAGDEFHGLARSYHELAAQMRLKAEQESELRQAAEEQVWINRQVSEMAIVLQGSVKVETAAAIFMSKLAGAVKAHYGILYIKRDDRLHFAAGYAHEEKLEAREPIAVGHGLVGQCAFDKQPLELDELPKGYIQIRSGLGEAAPSHLLIVPIFYEEDVVAVMELASFRTLDDRERRLIDQVSRNFGVLLNTLSDVVRIDELLRETLSQKEELETQTEELQAQTEELQAQTEELEAQAEELRVQTEELSEQAGLLVASNESLRLEKEQTLRQKDEIERQADEVLQQAEELRTQAEDLRLSYETATRQKQEIEQQASELAAQAEELQGQRDELQAQAEELQGQRDELQAQAEELQAQTEELAASNRNLHAQMELTERQKLEIQAQADEIYLAAQHKSEFLANVSHELRTPLNSLLILSQILAENKEGNLQAKQLEYVHTIFSAGKDLLQLIDEILDLAKLETGKMQFVVESTELREVADQLFRTFELQAQKKELAFDIRLDRKVPDAMVTDGHRLRQVLRNLLSNALKFTERGSVLLDIRRGDGVTGLQTAATAEDVVFSVTDTGIGIPVAQIESIFEAFQQADGTTSRKYGGTGLGLTISRELAGLLGGRIEADSTVGQGSVFHLILPASRTDAPQPAAVTSIAAAEQASKDKPSFMESFVPDISIANPKLLQFSEMEDDRAGLSPEDTVLLIIEEAADFAAFLLQLARSRGFKAIVALQGDQGLALAHAYKPDAILLDTDLPVLDGWSIINRLKSRPELRHIPVHVISAEETNQQSLSLGVLSFWKKPKDPQELETSFLQIESYIRRQTKSLLIVEDNPDLRKGLVAFIAHPDVHITAVATGREALEQLTLEHFDCMVLDLGLSDISGFDLLEQIKTNRKLQTLPVIIYTGKELSKQDEQRLKHYAESIVIKNVRSMERLYDETALYLHRITADLPPDKQKLIEKLHNPEAAFEGRRILLVDDDMRNIFALSSVLEGYNMEIHFAQNGREALRMLDELEGVELVFMDIMMPEMDGYETMRQIRSKTEYENLVIIALTARAMEEDRLKCLQAGASDYIPKPINTTQLVMMLKAWLIK
ncbi:response regulator [Gorillibacterium sp. sgz500922]|uniref:response regulator n=1 Tax=Gorillibacterium sp. sgz500922 TaxID=3446694 RepID=UPI003F679174